MFDLTGKTALVTGATGGIGGAIARALHAQGARVVLSGTREAVLQGLAASLGERAVAVAADLADPAAVRAPSSAARSCSTASRVPESTTNAPWACSALAISAPMPPVAPVTRAVLPVRSNMGASL